jgi:hypothetical protein
VYVCRIMFAFLIRVLYFCIGSRNKKSPPMSIKDKEEKAKRSEFVQGLLLSTIPDDIL